MLRARRSADSLSVMPTYTVYIQQVVSTAIDVEADSVEDALDTFHESEDMPGGITHQAFGSGATVDASGDWEPTAVYEDRNEVWRETSADVLDEPEGGSSQ